MGSGPDSERDHPIAWYAPGSRYDEGLFRAWYASVISAATSQADRGVARLWWERISVRYLAANRALLMYNDVPQVIAPTSSTGCSCHECLAFRSLGVAILSKDDEV